MQRWRITVLIAVATALTATGTSLGQGQGQNQGNPTLQAVLSLQTSVNALAATVNSIASSGSTVQGSLDALTATTSAIESSLAQVQTEIDALVAPARTIVTSSLIRPTPGYDALCETVNAGSGSIDLHVTAVDHQGNDIIPGGVTITLQPGKSEGLILPEAIPVSTFYCKFTLATASAGSAKDLRSTAQVLDHTTKLPLAVINAY